MPKLKITKRQVRRNRIRSKVAGTEKRPRLSVFRSLKTVYAQLIDDETGTTLAAASDIKEKSKDNKTARAKRVGVQLAQKAAEKKISQCVFDRGGYKYHGRIKAVADGAREGGLKF